MRIQRVLAAAFVALAIAAPASGADSAWTEVGRTPIPLYYYQGMTHDEAGNRYFTGVWFGLYRTDPALEETGRNDDVIGPEVHAREGYNHIGDPSYADGNLYLPLECYYPPAGNTCKTGSIGVADPETLEMEYYVKLDPAEISKAMWCEVSPDGTLLWTQEGRDLLAYDMADITAANAAPDAAPIKSVRKLTNAVPAHGITGATFIGDRLFVAGGDDTGGVISSIDLTTGASRFETRIEYIGESEGLDDDVELDPAADALRGSLHYMVMPYNEENYPTNGVTNGVIYHFESTTPPGPEATSVSLSEDNPSSAQYTDNATFGARLVDADGDPIGGETVTFSLGGTDQTATTASDGTASTTFSLTQTPGDYGIAVSYSDPEEVYAGSSTSAPFTIEKENSATSLRIAGKAQRRSLQATLYDADDASSGIGGRTVEFFADGASIGSATTNSSGIATIDIPARYRGGHHTYEARFSGDDYFTGSSDTASS